MAQQVDYFHSLIILLSPANEIKAPTADTKFCGEVAFQKWLTTGTQENEDSWAFHGKPKPCKLHPCNCGFSTAGTGGTGMECSVETAAAPGSRCSPGLRVVCLQHKCGDLVRIGGNSPRLLFSHRFREAVAPTGEQNPPDGQSGQSKERV